MTYHSAFYEGAMKRVSIRKYKRQSLSDENLQKVKNTIHNRIEEAGDLGINVRVKEEGYVFEKYLKGFIGSYGKIEAPHYLVVTNESHRLNLVETGRWIEKIIIDMTNHGIGTCWIGGQFKKNEILLHMGLENEEVVAIIAFGKPLDKTLQTISPKERKRKAIERWLNVNETTNRKETIISEEHPIKKGILAIQAAPSAINLQPWHCVLEGHNMHFYCKSKLSILEKIGFRLHYIDIGIAISHFEEVTKELGVTGKVEKLNVKNLKGYEYITSYVMSEDSLTKVQERNETVIM